MVEDEPRAQLWRRTRVLAVIAATTILAAAVATPFLVTHLDRFAVLGFPLGIFLLAEGLVVAAVIAAFWFASHQERIDRRHGAMEEI